MFDDFHIELGAELLFGFFEIEDKQYGINILVVTQL
jgi:hypothetical protein